MKMIISSSTTLLFNSPHHYSCQYDIKLLFELLLLLMPSNEQTEQTSVFIAARGNV